MGNRENLELSKEALWENLLGKAENIERLEPESKSGFLRLISRAAAAGAAHRLGIGSKEEIVDRLGI